VAVTAERDETERVVAPGSVSTAVLRGSLWTLALRWSLRLVGLVSTAIVARLLTPEDFGLMALVVSVLGLLEALTDTGAALAIVRHPRPERRHYDTVWTVNLIAHGAIAVVLALAAPLVAHLYGDPRYQPVLLVLAGAIAVRGLENIGIANFQRTFDFGREFGFLFATQLSATVVTIGAAFLFRSYWALAAGMVTRAVASVALSFAFQPYRPRLSLEAGRELIGFSLWTSVRSVALFFTWRADALVLAAFYPPAGVGLYTLARELALMATNEVLLPVGRALLPGFARIQAERGRLERAFVRALNVGSHIAMATGVGLCAVADQAVPVVYGEPYVDAVPLLEVLALATAVGSLTGPVGQFLTALGRMREQAVLWSVQAVVLVGTLLAVAHASGDLWDIALVRVAVAVLGLGRLLQVAWGWSRSVLPSLLWGVGRPGLAAAAMYASLQWLEAAGLGPGVATLLLEVVAGALVYLASAYLLWLVTGRPEGLESEAARRTLAALSRAG
jgi:O-antigen/teichoic acid export membrane protein